MRAPVCQAPPHHPYGHVPTFAATELPAQHAASMSSRPTCGHPAPNSALPLSLPLTVAYSPCTDLVLPLASPPPSQHHHQPQPSSPAVVHPFSVLVTVFLPGQLTCSEQMPTCLLLIHIFATHTNLDPRPSHNPFGWPSATRVGSVVRCGLAGTLCDLPAWHPLLLTPCTHP